MAGLVNKYVFAPKICSISIVNSTQLFPVRRILCLGKNYHHPSNEINNIVSTTTMDPPMIFTKPTDAAVDCHLTKTVKYPPHCSEMAWEAELVVCIGAPGSFIEKDKVNDHVFGYAVGIDFTALDLLRDAKKNGWPWDMAKAFDESAPMGAILPSPEWYDEEKSVRLYINDVLKQDGKFKDMIRSVGEVIVELSKRVALEPGDLIFTGTPSGVDVIKRGDKVRGEIDGLPNVEFTMV
jgi:fumarylpyruvate hydrolase